MLRNVINHKKIVFYLMIVIAIGGIYSYLVLPKQEAPDLNAPVAMITGIYPGASQSDVNKFVTTKIEKKLADMEEYDYASSYTYNSVTTVIVFMKYGIDIDKTWDKLRRDLADLQEELPKEVQKLQLKTDMAETAGMIISLTGEGYDYDELSFYGRKIIDTLQETEGVTHFDMIGEVGTEVEIRIDGSKMNQLNLSYGELSQLLQGQNLEIPSGVIETDSQDIPLQIKGSFESLEEIGNLVLDVSTENYSVLKLKDIATISFVDEDAATIYKRNGEKAILLVGHFENNRNVLTVGKQVRKEIQDIKKTLPEALKFEEVIFQPSEVSRAIDGFIMNLLMGIVLVIIVVFVGMGFRNAIIVSFAIPVSILTTLLAMPLFGIKIHTISITSFIVALGMLVDNAIVVSDSIQNRLDEGEEKIEACINGTKDVIIAILTSTLTTVAAFSPLILLNSLAGDYIESLPQVVIISLTASFLFAFLVTPCLAFVFFKPKQKGEDKKKRTFMRSLLHFGLKHKFISFGIGLLLIISVGMSFFALNVIFFPKADKNIMYIDVTAEKNISTDFTETITDQIEVLLTEEKGVLNYTTAIGGAMPKYYETLGVYPGIPEVAQVVLEVDLSKTDFHKNTEYAHYLQEVIDQKLIGGQAKVKELEYAEPVPAPILVRVLGEDVEQVEQAAKKLEQKLKQIQGTVNVGNNFPDKVYEYEIQLDNDVISYYGLIKYDVLNEVSIALRGREVSIYRKNGREYPIILGSDIKSLEKLSNLMIKSSVTGNKHLLDDLGEINRITVRPDLKKYNGKNSIFLMADLLDGYDSGDIEREFKNQIKDIDLGEVELQYDGESSKITVYFGNLAFSAIFAVIMILTILLLQFKNFRQALIILLTLPLSASGAIYGLFVMNQPVSFTGVLGIISLIGIVVNNAIVLVDYIDNARKQGMEVDEAVMKASVVRFRPIMLSTVTTIIGLIPLMLSNSELFKPMAVALVFGLAISTFLTLVFIPLTYSVVFHKE